MHLKRQKATTKLPIPRKGLTFIARALSNYRDSVPVVIAVRDMLKLARTSKEVTFMINKKFLKINNKDVKDYRQAICLFNIFKADKSYILSISTTGKFNLKPSNSTSRLTKIIGKKILKKNLIQYNLHDGTNLISNEKSSVGDSFYLDEKNKVEKVIKFDKGTSVFILYGKYVGNEGKVESRDGNSVVIKLKNKEKSVKLKMEQLITQ